MPDIIKTFSLEWWQTPLMPTFGRQKQADVCEFKTSLVYKVSSRTTRAVTQRNPVLKKKKSKTKQTNKGCFIIPL